MPKKRFQPEEIIGKLRHASVLLGQGKKITEGAKALGLTDATYYRWRQEFGRMTTAQAKGLKKLARAARGGGGASAAEELGQASTGTSGGLSPKRPLGCLRPEFRSPLFTPMRSSLPLPPLGRRHWLDDCASVTLPHIRPPHTP
jgi:putative transposase